MGCTWVLGSEPGLCAWVSSTFFYKAIPTTTFYFCFVYQQTHPLGLFPSLELGYLFHPAEAYAFLFPKLTEIRIWLETRKQLASSLE